VSGCVGWTQPSTTPVEDGGLVRRGGRRNSRPREHDAVPHGLNDAVPTKRQPIVIHFKNRMSKTLIMAVAATKLEVARVDYTPSRAFSVFNIKKDGRESTQLQ
jgi:hypothetical protein